MPLVQTRGAASAQGFGEFAQASAIPNYIEDVFSCFLYTGNGSTQTITNGIDLSTKGGLTWIKNRVTATTSNIITDTVRGKDNGLVTNSTGAQNTVASGMGFGVTNCFLTNGFTLRNSSDFTAVGENFVSWTFRKQPKFFDVVTYTGNGSSITVPHSLGSAPGCIIVKAVSSSPAVGQNWIVYHRSVVDQGRLNSTDAFIYSGIDNITSTSFDPTGTGSGYNVSGVTYVAYLFAHDAGGFGLTGTDNVISCGSFTTDASGNATVSLGYEPQFILYKRTLTAGNWVITDNMRGVTANASNNTNYLLANTADAEANITWLFPTATGFTGSANGIASTDFIYIAIRRGPMKVPTLGTSVFYPSTQTGVNNSTGQFITTGFPPDLSIEGINEATSGTKWTLDRLRGNTQFIGTNTTAAESNVSPYGINFTTSNVGVQNLDYGTTSTAYVNWLFRRAPSFFDEVCYTGTGTNQFINHNLGVRPDLYIVKRRSATENWAVTVNGVVGDSVGLLNSTIAFGGSAYNNGYLVNGTVPASNFGAGFGSVNNDAANASGSTYVAYLFATCAGVSKVGTFTGNGSTQTIDCGFGAGGARFVLIKRTDAAGDWYVYDTARGMTVLNSPYASLNNAGGPTATLGSVTTVSTGFALNAAILAAINTNAASYIFLAIA